MIIDIHAHMGDLLSTHGHELIYKEGIPYPRFGVLMVDDIFAYRQNAITALCARLFKERIPAEERRRNAAGTLQNLRRMLDATAAHDVRHGGDGSVCAFIMPISPHVPFDAVKHACALDARLKPFGAPDLTLGKDAPADAARQAHEGAWGLKIHPIMQCACLDGAEVSNVLEAWRTAAPHRPVLLHTGMTSYYPEAMRHLERPEYSDPAAAARMAAAFPDIPFILGHAGLFEMEAWFPLSRFPNVHVDGSFQGPKQWRQLLDVYGGERVMYASDWHYGRAQTALRSVEIALRGQPLLREKVLWRNASAITGLEKANDDRNGVQSHTKNT